MQRREDESDATARGQAEQARGKAEQPEDSPTPSSVRAAVSPPPTTAAALVKPAPKNAPGIGTPITYRPRATNTWRFVRAYLTTFQVIGSYLWLSWWARFFGQAFRRQRIGPVHKRNAALVNATILELQGLFIKVGQLMSIMANFLPEEFRSELEGLQDQVPPRPFDEISERIDSELHGKVDELFASFDRTCIASASLGQVHEARLKDGRRVAVKVQHKDIDEMVKLDLVTIRRIMMIVQWFVPVQGLDAYYHQIKGILSEELDFAREADNIERISRNFTNSDRVIFPTPVRELSTHRVITTTFVEGKKIGDLAGIDALGIDRKDLASRLVRAYCQMIFVDGVYHADPHPGNLLVREDGALILLDFGAIAELSPSMREGIPEFLEGVLRRDTDRLIKALRKMGFLARGADEQVSEKIIEYFHRKFQDEVKLESFNLKDIKIDPQRGFENLLDLRKMNIGMKELSSSFHIPKDWVLLERTIILLYGCCSMLDPELNPMGIIQPYLQEFVFGNRDWQQIVVETVRDMAMSAVTLPEDLKKYLVRGVRGDLEIRVKGVQEGVRTLYATGRQLIYTVIGLGCGWAALQLHFHGDDALARWPLGAAIACVVILLTLSIFARPKR